MKKTIILGIETSCDDTSAAIIHGKKILSNVVASQLIHSQYGGIVPELASRAHQQNIIPVVTHAIHQANISKKQINAIAFTKGPGLLGSLLVGMSFSKSLALSLQVPLIEVNHMQAHILAHFIENNEIAPEFPFLCLTVSGGHTQILLVKDYFTIELLGETLDDAVGEAFDKIGKMLGLNYPAGQEIDQLAKLGNPKKFHFTIPQVDNFNFSFSGIKTSVLYFLQKQVNTNPDFIAENLHDLCASVQQTLIDALINKLEKAIEITKLKHVAIAGGVSANSHLRERIKNLENLYPCHTYIPKIEYTTDNAAMIALVGSLKYERNMFTDLHTVSSAKYSLDNL